MMATRYRVIQYDGTNEEIQKLFDKSISGVFSPGNVRISAWEAQKGDIVETKPGLIPWAGLPRRQPYQR